MASKIEWTGETWNPIVGCSVVSPGCTNCYAMRMAARLEAMGLPGYAGLTRPSQAGPVWTGEVRLVESALLKPLRWRKPRMIFVNSMSDLFHESIPDAWIDRVFAVMALCPQHTFQVLTKRSGRMRAYLTDEALNCRISAALGCMLDGDWVWKEGRHFRARIEHMIGVFLGEDTDDDGNIVYHADPMPLPNVWLGVSAEDQRRADERVPDLLATPAAVRFVSAEPLLGPIRLDFVAYQDGQVDALRGDLWGGSGTGAFGRGLDWIIVGGESGSGARPMHPDWARSIRDQCAAAGVAFFFKQWGDYMPSGQRDASGRPWNGRYEDGDIVHVRLGKRAAGRLLDGVEHNGMPGQA